MKLYDAPMKPVYKVEYYNIINDVFDELDRSELINKVKIYQINHKVWTQSAPVIAMVPYYNDLVMRNLIILFKYFKHIDCQKVKRGILQHEATHIVDLHNRASYLGPNSDIHDREWRKLMHKINCTMYACDYVSIRSPNWSCKIKKPYKYYSSLWIEKSSTPG